MSTSFLLFPDTMSWGKQVLLLAEADVLPAEMNKQETISFE